MTDEGLKELIGWLDDFEARAAERSDINALHLVQLFRRTAGLANKHEPIRSLQLCDEGLRLARQLNEVTFELLFTHAKTLARSEIRDFRGALDEATLAAVLLTKAPDYLMRACTFHDLIAVYQAVDAFGHASQIHTSLDRLQQALHRDDHCVRCLQWCWSDLHMTLGDFAAAEQRILSIMATAAARESEKATANDASKGKKQHTQLACYHRLCYIAWQQQDGLKLQQWADAADITWPDIEPQTAAESYAWQAISVRQRGDEIAARSLYRKAQTRTNQATHLVSSRLWEALSGFHELTGDIRRALFVRRRQLRATTGRGMLGPECLITIKIAELKRALGQDTSQEQTSVRSIASRLPRPDIYLNKLQQAIQNPSNKNRDFKGTS